MKAKMMTTQNTYVDKGGRPKNFKEDSVVISVRVPKSKKSYFLNKFNELLLNDKITKVNNNAE